MNNWLFHALIHFRRMRRRDPPNEPFSLPRDDEHVAIFGHTGSGKTQMGAWLLSTKDLQSRPHIIIDYKGDELLNSLENTREIGFEIPKKSGLYILHARVDLQDDMENWLWRIHEAENIHLYADEGYMLPRLSKFGAVDAIQTQGRSKRVSMTTLSQRPIGIPRYVVSEASHVALFHLNDERDVATAEQIVPKGFAEWTPREFRTTGLPRYACRWYSVKTRSRFILRPVPNADEIKHKIDSPLTPKHRWL